MKQTKLTEREIILLALGALKAAPQKLNLDWIIKLIEAHLYGEVTK